MNHQLQQSMMPCDQRNRSQMWQDKTFWQSQDHRSHQSHTMMLHMYTLQAIYLICNNFLRLIVSDR